MNATATKYVSESRYVFRLPLRLVHWTLFFSTLVLSVTGYWIGSGNLPAGPGGTFQMGWIRYGHTVFGWVLLAALLYRILLFFSGDAYIGWRDFLPLRRADFVDIKDTFLFYTFVRTRYPHAGYGHNHLAAAIYGVVYLLFLFMGVSGLALHGMAFETGWQSWLTWPLVFVSAPTLRLMHHMGMWLIWGFVAHHMASAILVDREMRGGLMGGIFSGYKHLPERTLR